MKILGIDPGKDNYALVLLRNRKVVYAMMLKHTIKSMAQKCEDQRVLYRKEIRRILAKLRPDAVMVEQFAVRRFSTQQAEVVNLMIGGLMMHCDAMKIIEKATMASTWKGAFNRVASLDELYKFAESIGLEKHVVDALCLATYMDGGMAFSPLAVKRLKINLKRCKKFLLKNSPDHVDVKKKKRDARLSAQAKRRRGSKVSKRKVLAKRK